MRFPVFSFWNISYRIATKFGILLRFERLTLSDIQKTSIQAYRPGNCVIVIVLVVVVVQRL